MREGPTSREGRQPANGAQDPVACMSQARKAQRTVISGSCLHSGRPSAPTVSTSVRGHVALQRRFFALAGRRDHAAQGLQRGLRALVPADARVLEGRDLRFDPHLAEHVHRRRLVAAPHAGAADRLVREQLRVEQAVGRQGDADAAAREGVELLERGAQVAHVQRARRDHHVRGGDAGGAPVVVPGGLDRPDAVQALLGGLPPEHVQHAGGEVQAHDVVAGARQRQRQRAGAAAHVQDALARPRAQVLDEAGDVRRRLVAAAEVPGAAVPERRVVGDLTPVAQPRPLGVPVLVLCRHGAASPRPHAGAPRLRPGADRTRSTRAARRS